VVCDGEVDAGERGDLAECLRDARELDRARGRRRRVAEAFCGRRRPDGAGCETWLWQRVLPSLA
jgi:hypothetical protein